MSDKPLLPLKTYCARVGMTRHQGYAAAAAGTLPTVKIGKCIMVPVAKADRALGIAQDAPAPQLMAAE